MTALRMKQSSVNLINQIDDTDIALLEKILLFLKVNVQVKSEGKDVLSPDQKRRMALVEKYAGAFSASQTTDWKQDKEEYIQEKYG